MKNRRDAALALRRGGNSYQQISRRLDIAKSTLSYWFKRDRLSARLKKILTRRALRASTRRVRAMVEANKRRWHEQHEKYRQQATREFSKRLSDRHFAPGLLLYWGEGDKHVKNGIVRISNVDPRLLAVFIRFLVKTCGWPRHQIHAWLLLYPDHNGRDCRRYWSRSLGLPEKNFLKSQHVRGREHRRRIDYGVCTVQVYSRELKEKILRWIDLLAADLLK